jgi:hypothetical protein
MHKGANYWAKTGQGTDFEDAYQEELGTHSMSGA